MTNGTEFIAATAAENPTSVFRATATRTGGNLVITFPTVSGKTYRLERSDTLAPVWVNTGLTPVSGNGSVQQFTVPAGSPARRFFRVVTE